MQNKTILRYDIALVGGIRLLAQAYEQISVMKMQKVRSSVLVTRHFLDQLSLVFTDVKQSYKDQIQRQLNKNPNKLQQLLSLTTRAHNGKTVSVLITANSRLYGDIDQKIINLFLTEVIKGNTDILAIGKVGKQILESNKKTFTYFDLSDQIKDLTQLSPILNHLNSYEHINVYYGRFQNVITQLPTVQTVSGEDSLKSEIAKESSTPTPKTRFAFEPSLEYILNLFEKQVISALFKQTLHESELSRHASRIKAMEDSLTNIEKLEKKLKVQEKILQKQLQNKKRMEVLSGMKLWR